MPNFRRNLRESRPAWRWGFHRRGLFDYRIAVFDSSLTFRHYLGTDFRRVAGLDFTSSGNLVATGRDPGQLKEYDASGAIVNSFTNVLIGEPIDTKVDAAGNVFIGSQTTGNIQVFNTSGTLVRTFGSYGYEGIALLPGDMLWGSRDGPGNEIDVYDLTTDALLTTFLPAGVGHLVPLEYSEVLDSMFGTDNSTPAIHQFDTSGNVLMTFTATGLSAPFGATLAADGNLYATSGGNIAHWSLDGTFLGPTNVSAHVRQGVNIVQVRGVATVSEPGTLALFGIGLAGLGLFRRMKLLR